MTTFTVIIRNGFTADDMMDEKDMAKLDKLWAMRSKDFNLGFFLGKTSEGISQHRGRGKYVLHSINDKVTFADEAFQKVSFTLQHNKHSGDVAIKNAWVNEIIRDEIEDVVLE